MCGDFCDIPFDLLLSPMKKLAMFWKIADRCKFNQVVTLVANVVDNVVSTGTKSIAL